jgi:hypothetical protein
VGSNVTSVGGKAGQNLFSFTAAGQDTAVLVGALGITASSAPSNLFNCGEASEVLGFKNFVFTVGGGGTGLDITMYFTTDRDTAYNKGGTDWHLITAPSDQTGIANWSNPLRTAPGQDTLKCDIPCLAFRAVSSATVGGTISGTVTLKMFAVP